MGESGHAVRGIVQRLKGALRARFGIWVLFEARNKVLLGPAALRRQLLERRETRRLRAQVGPLSARVAVVVPTYRRPQSLLAALDSVRSQTFDDYVVIVVDDGGGLPELPADPRIRSVSLSGNTRCLGVVRNVGIALTRSDHIAFLDDDNRWYPNHLAVTVQALDAGKDLVYTAVRRIVPDGSEYDVLATPFDRAVHSDNAFVDANSVVVRRARGHRFSRIPRSRRTLPPEDWEFVHRVSRRGRVGFVDEVTVEYLVNPESFYTTWSQGTQGHGTQDAGE